MKQLSALILLTFLLSCTNNSGDTTATNDSSEENSSPRENEIGEAPAEREQYFIWQVDTDNKTLTKNPQLHPSFYSVDTLIMGLNERYPQIQLEKKHLGHDTLYMAVKDATYLTNQMGSAGSEQYIAQAVLNLTSVQGINHVRIDFEEGSHAAPDVWSRKAFASYKEVR